MSEESDHGDANNAMIQMLANINAQLNHLTTRMDRLERPTAPPRPDMPEAERRGEGGHARPPPMHHGPRMREPFDEDAPVRPHHQQPSEVKMSPPTFAGRVDPEAYLDWERRMEHIFECYRYEDPRRVALATAQFTDHALTWWDREIAERRRLRYPGLTNWEELKHVMRRRYVPPHFHRELQKRFRRLTQGNKSVEEYFEEFEHLRNRLEIEDSLESLMAQFLDGLQERIARKVERQTYHDLGELLHLATQVEQQNKRKHSTSTTRPKAAWNTAPRTFEKGNGVQADSRFKGKPVEGTSTSRTGPSQAPTTTQNPKPQRSRDIVCFKCSGRGHISRECPNQRVMIITASGDYESQDEGEEEQPQIEDKDDIEYADAGELLVMRRVLNARTESEEDVQRENIFHSKCTVQGKVCSLIIDGGSCTNAASLYMVEKLGLERIKHPNPYKLRWLNDKSELHISEQVKISFSVGRYNDQVLCDVVPMQAGHLLLGRPWQFDRETTHNGRTNLYSFVLDKHRYNLAPMTPQQVREMQTKMVKDQKSRKGNFLVNSGSIRKTLVTNPSNVLLLMFKELLSAEVADVRLPTEVQEMLETYADVFPEELPTGLPPIRGIEHGIDFIPGAQLPN